MACDGLWDVIKNEELFELLNKFKENGTSNLAVDLAKHALDVGTTDNVSIIIIELE
jgi:serine/threonine protein phosphatase PrpC